MENPISKALKVIGVLEIAAGLIIGLILGYEDSAYGSSEMNFGVVFYWTIIGFVSGMLFIGFSEVIQLLHNINEKLRKNFNMPEEENEVIEKVTIKKGQSKYEQWKEHYEDKKDM